MNIFYSATNTDVIEHMYIDWKVGYAFPLMRCVRKKKKERERMNKREQPSPLPRQSIVCNSIITNHVFNGEEREKK